MFTQICPCSAQVNAVHKCGKDTYDPLWFGQQWLTAQHTADFGPWEDCYKCITTPWEECTYVSTNQLQSTDRTTGATVLARAVAITLA
jgi:hypothetical protein